jgi:hypothetical protein
VPACLATLREGCASRDAGLLIMALKTAIPDYTPSEHVLARVMDLQRAAD